MTAESLNLKSLLEELFTANHHYEALRPAQIDTGSAAPPAGLTNTSFLSKIELGRGVAYLGWDTSHMKCTFDMFIVEEQSISIHIQTFKEAKVIIEKVSTSSSYQLLKA